MARFQHPFIVCNAERGSLSPGDLDGKRVGVRSYTVTTAMWVRAFLANEHGVDPETIRWVTFEDAHVAGFTDPPNTERARPGQDLQSMLLSGEIDAAIIGAPIHDARIRTLLPDPQAAARAWQEKYGAIQINHMVAVKSSLCRSHPELVSEVYRLLHDSRRAAGTPLPGGIDMNPFGLEQNRRNLEVAIEFAHRQKLIPRKFAVDELFEA
jgi:4,5-dihydroxyphthalate decarboxylase